MARGPGGTTAPLGTGAREPAHCARAARLRPRVGTYSGGCGARRRGGGTAWPGVWAPLRAPGLAGEWLGRRAQAPGSNARGRWGLGEEGGGAGAAESGRDWWCGPGPARPPRLPASWPGGPAPAGAGRVPGGGRAAGGLVQSGDRGVGVGSGPGGAGAHRPQRPRRRGVRCGAPCLPARLCAGETRRVAPEAPGRPPVAAGPGCGRWCGAAGASGPPRVLNDASPGSLLPVGGAGSVVRRPFLKPPPASEVSADVF